jgi:hypothetical protein
MKLSLLVKQVKADAAIYRLPPTSRREDWDPGATVGCYVWLHEWVGWRDEANSADRSAGRVQAAEGVGTVSPRLGRFWKRMGRHTYCNR